MSAEGKPGPTLSGASPGGLGANAPSMLLPMRFMLAGMLALTAGVIALVARPELLATYHYNQHIIAVTHLFVLGWILTMVMGATYQLVPVALETRLYSERLARWQFLFHLVGFLGMVAMFWTWNMTAVAHYGSVLAVGITLYGYNIVRTLTRVPRWTVVATAVASSLAWLSLGVLAGLFITAGKCAYDTEGESILTTAVGPFLNVLKVVAKLAGRFDQISAMHAHAHLGAVGVFVMLIVGISYKLIPMFTLSELQSPFRAQASIALLNVGLLASFFAMLLRSQFRLPSALLVVAGVICYGVEIRAILKARKRRSLDWGMRYFVTAIALLAPVSVLALVLAWPGLPLTAFTGQLENLYGFVAFVGVVSFAIMGMLYKILPFLVWFRCYSPRIGLAKVPSLADLYSAGLQMVGYWTYVGGLLVTSAGILSARGVIVRAGCFVIALSVGVLMLNVVRMLSHLFRPRTEPLPGRPMVPAKLAAPIPQRSL